MREQEPYKSFAEKKQKKHIKTKENVKVSINLIAQIKAHKQKTGVTITAFIEQAIEHKLKTEKTK